MAVNYLTSVPRLLGRENYQDWSFAVENVFVLEGLSKCIDGTETDSTTVAKAKAKLILTLDPSLYLHIKEAKTAKDVWDTLRKLYEDTGTTRKIGLLRTLISLRLENCDSMESYVNQVIETAQKLNRTGFKIDDTWVGSLLLAGLPEKFMPMILAIEHSGIDVRTDEIKSKLLDMHVDVENKAGGAFTTKGNWKKRTTGSKQVSTNLVNKDRSNVICFRCKKKGHFMNKCPSLVKEDDKDKQKGGSNAFSAVFLSGKFNKTDFFIDSGFSTHLTARKDWLKNIRDEHELKEITVANKTTLSVVCAGDIEITTLIDNKRVDITIHNVLYVPGLTTNLLSVSQLIKNKNKVIFNYNGCNIYNSKGILIATADLLDNIYRLNFEPQMHSSLAATAVTEETWHRRLGHINNKDLNLMKSSVVEGMECKGKRNRNVVCEVCCEGKQARLPFNHKGHRASALLEVIHGDLCGPMEAASLGGSKFFLILQDDYSKMSFVYFLKSKDETFEAFQKFKNFVEKQKEVKIKVFRTDGGGEFCSNEFENFLMKNGIVHQKSNAYSPQQNGTAERLNRSIVEKARCLLFDAKLGNIFWAEAVNTAIYLRNRSIVTGLDKTPIEVWTNRKPDISNLRIFGSEVMMHIPKQKRRKWDKKAKKTILVGYCDNVKGYRLYDPNLKEVVISRDVIVNERHSEVSVVINDRQPELLDSVGDSDEHLNDNFSDHSDTLSVSEETSDNNSNINSDFVLDISTEVPETIRKSKRVPKPRKFEDYVSYLAADVNNLENDPVSVDEVMSRPDRDQWTTAMNEELQSFEDNAAWELANVPESGTVVKCKWVFKRKFDSAEKVRYRARLVAKGFAQREGIDFNETFSPVVRHSTLRLLIAISVKLDLDIFHLDVTTAFLNGDLKENVFMMIPEGMEIHDSKNKVLKLKKAIYGLKQSSRSWYEKVDNFLKKLNYKRSDLEPCLYSKMKNNLKTIVAIYVDDFFIFTNDKHESDDLKLKLSESFKIKDLGLMKNCLVIQVNVDKKNDIITLDQTKYINQLLKKFDMLDSKPVNTPMEVGLNLDRNNDDEGNSMTRQPYQQLIGSLMYLSILTRPDISFSVSYLSQFNDCHNETHWKHAKRLLRYLQKTKDYGLKFIKDDIFLECFVDADWASNTFDRRSYTGFCFRLSCGPIAWESRKQSTVALSSTEAEYMALSEAAKEAIYLKSLLFELTGIDKTVTLFNDNMGAQKLTLNPIFHRRTKHIDIKHHFVREVVANNQIKLKYLQTENMPADVLTKSLSYSKHDKFIKQLGVMKVM